MQRSAAELAHSTDRARGGAVAGAGIVGNCRGLRRVLNAADRIAPTNLSVLVTEDDDPADEEVDEDEE